MNTDDAHLIEACCNQDREAQRILYERFAPQMFGLLLRYAPSRAAAEDLLHDGFIKVFKDINRLRDSRTLAGWIRSVMIFTAISSFRVEQRNSPTEDFDNSVSEGFNGAEEILDAIDIEIIQKAISELPAQYRLAFNLCEIEGYSSAEAANLLGVEAVTVRSNLHRAKLILRRLLAKFFPQYDTNTNNQETIKS